jgi:hypothetical protein
MPRRSLSAIGKADPCHVARRETGTSKSEERAMQYVHQRYLVVPGIVEESVAFAANNPRWNIGRRFVWCSRSVLINGVATITLEKGRAYALNQG